jgi:3'-phosphoadenosine 5'-phosphosulfate sulfotransferase (PAPS reductase)/FAD synthetase
MDKRAVTRDDLFRARLRAFRDRVARARDAIAAMLANCRRPYVAFSGGKDSLCVLALTASVAPGIAAIWSDDELEYPEQIPYIPRAAEQLGACLTIVLGYAPHGGWFYPWQDQPFWRTPLPGSRVIGMRVEDWAPHAGYDGVLLGLRRQESARRRTHLAASGPWFRRANGMWQANPLAGWDVADVWALIAAWDLPYNPVYDRLAAIGVPRDRQRVGPLPLAPGWYLRVGWPELYQQLVTRYGRRWES